MKGRFAFVSRVILLLFFLILLAPFVDEAPAAPPKPKTFLLGTHEIGTGGHLLVSLVAETITEKSGIITRTIPNATYVGRALMARLGRTYTTVEMSTGMKFLQEGLYEYAGYDWGPQPIRYIFIPQHVGLSIAVSAKSDITSGKQLKGKRVPRIPGSSSLDQVTMACLAFFGVYENDVKNVDYPSYGATTKAHLEGRVDVDIYNVTSSPTHELESVHGVRWLEMPADDKEGWKRARKVSSISPKIVSKGPGIKPGKPLTIATCGYPCIAAYDHLDPNIAYWITKSIVELYGDYKGKHASLKDDWSIDKHWALWEADVVPLHGGSVQYFKDAGMWTDAREKMQLERLNRQTQLKKLWDKVVEEASSQKISAKDFPKYWLKKRADF